MKKLIYSLGIAMVAAFAASADRAEMRPQLAVPANYNIEAQKLAPSTLSFDRISPDNRKVKKAKATSVEDFVGSFQWKGRNQLASVAFPNEGVLTIELDPSKPDRVLITGFEYLADPGLDGYFDSASGRLYIPNQIGWFNDYYNEEAWFFNWTVVNGEYEDEDTGEIKKGYLLTEAPDEHPFYFTLTEKGIQAGDVDPEKWDNNLYTDEELIDLCCIAASSCPSLAEAGGFFWMCFGVTGTRLNDFEFIEDEWQLLGEADFEDAWFPIFWDNGAPIISVPVYFNKTKSGNYLLYDPYGYGGDENPYVYYGLNVSDKIGYLKFNLNDDECVLFEPMIYSIDLLADEEGNSEPTYCFNNEGYQYYVNNASTSEIIAYCVQNDMDVSRFNRRTNVVSINNAQFSFGISPSLAYTWDGYDMYGFITLPANWEDGVDSVLGETIAAPATYYNLQGVRVNNPEKGQLVIVKQGKTTKKIIL